METHTIKLSKIKPNPANPRLIKDDKFNKLVQSLKDFPEMADIRPIVVNKDMVILGGNMRFKAMKGAGWKECPVVIAELTEEQEKEFIIKDNVGFGEWDFSMLAKKATQPKKLYICKAYRSGGMVMCAYHIAVNLQLNFQRHINYAACYRAF